MQVLVAGKCIIVGSLCAQSFNSSVACFIRRYRPWKIAPLRKFSRASWVCGQDLIDVFMLRAQMLVQGAVVRELFSSITFCDLFETQATDAAQRIKQGRMLYRGIPAIAIKLFHKI